MQQDKLIVKGARVHNLKNIDVELPRDQLIVITGLSGSGKSSLAFDTIYAEGQRRYVESLSAYARQFLGVMERPDVDYIEGLSPAISIEQKTISHNPRSTVGTVTEIYDYLRLLFARVGTQHCYNCGKIVRKQSVDQIIDSVMDYRDGTAIIILAPLVRGRKGHYRDLFEKIIRDGFLRVRVDGEIREIRKGMQISRFKIHTIEVVVDRVSVQHGMRSRIAESIETAIQMGSGIVIVNSDETDHLYSQHLACPDCAISYDEAAPNSFSFNSPYGACQVCNGLGEMKEFDTRLIMPDKTLSINKEGLAPLGKPRDTWLWSQVRALTKAYDISLEKPVGKLAQKHIDFLLYGAGDEKFDILYTYPTGRIVTYRQRYSGLIKTLQHYYEETSSEGMRQWIESYMSTKLCHACMGGRLRKESLAVRLYNTHTSISTNIDAIVKLSIHQAGSFFTSLKLTPKQEKISHQIIIEIQQRLQFLMNVGLDYLTLDRSARTLSGGEAQRIRLATQIGSQLVGVLYILDEPSIGLHQRDNLKLIDSLKNLRDLGNTVIVVEHDREMITSADFIVDLGPGAGEHGGYLVTTGKPSRLLKKSETISVQNRQGPIQSLTGLYLSGKKKIEFPNSRRKGNGSVLRLNNCTGNNLQSITAEFPLGTFICITGVSGSGKSTLIADTLYRILAKKFYDSKEVPLPHRSVEGLEYLDKVIDIDQSPIGRTPRSNPATYTGLFTFIRDLYAQLPEAKIRGYRVGRFSFNVKGGRCDGCEGDGVRKIEMNFLPNVYVTCDVCKGKRYNRETLEILYKGKSIADALAMTVDEAIELLRDIPRIRRKLDTLHDVGLGYIRLGQQATTLSGGEAQRVKLSTELSKVGTGKTLYILDEPTTGLHFEDTRMLLSVLTKLVDKGNTVIVIEHNMDVIKTADWIIDLGPEGGDEGGKIVAEGTPEEVARNLNSYTGKFLMREIKDMEHR